MLNTKKPTTVGGIKSLAKHLKRQGDIPYLKALDDAARVAGYHNYQNANRQLETSTQLVENFITAHWNDPQRKPGEKRAGRMTLKIELPGLMGELFSKGEIAALPRSGRTRLVTLDQVVMDNSVHSKDRAKDVLYMAARHLYFMLATGLRPPIGKNRIPRRYKSLPDIPEKDHSYGWMHPDSGTYVITDEPYQARMEFNDHQVERDRWSETHAWDIKLTAWSGLWNPGMTELYVASERASKLDLDALVNIINTMPENMNEASWEISEGSWGDVFKSPLVVTQQDMKRARAKDTVYAFQSKKTIPMGWNASSDRRPAGNMSVKNHKLAGQLIKTVMWSSTCSHKAHYMLNSVRSKLEDWMSHETRNNRISDDEFFDIYYRGHEQEGRIADKASTPKGCQSLLGELKRLLKKNYPDSEPLRRIMKKIDAVQKNINDTNL